ncbi:hypothetical protein BDW66DRAFT_128760 [Aspergillus desertorum]
MSRWLSCVLFLRLFPFFVVMPKHSKAFCLVVCSLTFSRIYWLELEVPEMLRRKQSKCRSTGRDEGSRTSSLFYVFQPNPFWNQKRNLVFTCYVLRSR